MDSIVVPIVAAVAAGAAKGCAEVAIGATLPGSVADSNSTTKTILIFGASGAGKSSLINTLTGSKLDTGGGPKGVSTECSVVKCTYKNITYKIIDTPGLNESQGGTVPAEEACKQVMSVVKTVRKANLLVMVVSGRRTTHEKANYDLFVKTMTKNLVPLIIVVTHCEGEDGDIQSCMREYKETFDVDGMKFQELVRICH